jgi:hypothetical protein
LFAALAKHANVESPVAGWPPRKTDLETASRSSRERNPWIQ